MPVVPRGHVQELGKRVGVLGTEWGQVCMSKHGGWAIPCKILNPPPRLSSLPLAPLGQPDSTPEHPDPGLPGGGVTESPAGGKGRGIPGCHREDPRFSRRDRGARHEGEDEGSNPTVVY